MLLDDVVHSCGVHLDCALLALTIACGPVYEDRNGGSLLHSGHNGDCSGCLPSGKTVEATAMPRLFIMDTIEHVGLFGRDWAARVILQYV
jgi:hypothetical protein